MNEELLKLGHACRDHLDSFVNVFLKDDPSKNFYVPTRPYRVFDTVPKFQRDIYELLDNIKKIKRLVLASPRSFMKSMTCSIQAPIKYALFQQFKEILIVSNSERLAIEFLRQIRVNIESNGKIRELFQGSLESEKWTETQLILQNKCSIRACGVGAQIRGFRPDLIILDDIESDESVESEDMRRKLKEWLFKAAINALTVDGCLVYVGTTLSRLSLLFEFVNNPPEGWTAVFNQAYIGGIEAEGHELWPEVWPHERLQSRKKEIGSSAFSAEFMNNPIPSEGNRFNPSTFRFFEDRDLIGKSTGRYISIDPAFSETGDYGVIMELLHDSNDNIYVDRYFRRKTTSGEMISYFKHLYRQKRNEIRKVGNEANGPQKSFYDQLVNECNRDGLYPPFEKLMGVTHNANRTHRNKTDRVTYTVQPRLEAGKLFFRRDQTELLDELTLFPESRNDDLCDCLAYGISILEPYMTYEDSIGFSFENEEPALQYNGITGYGER